MQLYVGKAADFVRDTVQSSLAERLGDVFYQYYGFHVSPSELNSWRNSLTALSSHLQYARLRDQGVILEMQLPLTSARLDCMLTGKDHSGIDRALLIELKQWTAARTSDWDDCVETVVGGSEQALLHPSVQANQYKTWLQDTNEAFYSEPPLQLNACSWLHNMVADNAAALRAAKFRAALENAPLFIADDGPRFLEHITANVGGGKGLSILERVTSARSAPSKKLMAHTAAMIKGEPVYTLLDDQLVAYQAILAVVRRALKKGVKQVVILRGGPGTGKSVLALNVMATLLRMGVNAQHATGSKAFTETLWKIIGSRCRPQFRYFHNYA
jgi:hypothetical protein